MKKLLGICALVAALSGSGCAIPNRYLHSPEQQGEALEGRKQAVLKAYFTEAGQKALADIPLIKGVSPFMNAWASGQGFTSKAASCLVGHGYHETVIVSNDEPGDELLVHEFIHHLTNRGFLDVAGFRKVWKRFKKKDHEGIVEYVERHVNQQQYSFLAFFEIISKDYERMAYLYDRILWRFDAPTYLLDFYRPWLKVPEQDLNTEPKSPEP